MPRMPVIDHEKCNNCGLCISVCACHALVLIDNIVTVVETEACGWCLQCEVVCPTEAISCPFEIVIEEQKSTDP